MGDKTEGGDISGKYGNPKILTKKFDPLFQSIKWDPTECAINITAIHCEPKSMILTQHCDPDI